LDFASNVKKSRLDWKRVMFTDRKKFLFKHPGSSTRPNKWVLGQQQPTTYSVTHPQAYNVYGGITYFGPTKLIAVAGSSKHKTCYKTKQGQAAKNITAGEYEHVLLTSMLPAGKHIFGSQGMNMWYFQQDNDPTHRNAAKHISKYSTQHGCNIELLKAWPPNSPDLNLIENVWGYVDHKVQQKICNNFDEFKTAVDTAFTTLPKDILQNLFHSMGKRIDMCLKSGGDTTPY
jgi:hypothetical protein